MKLLKGMKVMYKGAWGTKKATKGIITGIGTKDGKKVYDVKTKTGEHFGYKDQFKRLK